MRDQRSPLVYVTFAAVAVIGVSSLPWLSVARGDADKKPKLSVREMKKKMNGWARELGVKCSHCHVKQGDEYDYEATTPPKEVAAFCETQFVDRLQLKGKAVSCQDCHDKRPLFLPRKQAPAPSVEPGAEQE